MYLAHMTIIVNGAYVEYTIAIETQLLEICIVHAQTVVRMCL